MNKPKFTPGPLMVCPAYADNGALSHYELRREETGELVAEVGDPDAMINETYKVEKANVTLYAAAPEMYDVLQHYFDLLEQANTGNAVAECKLFVEGMLYRTEDGEMYRLMRDDYTGHVCICNVSVSLRCTDLDKAVFRDAVPAEWYWAPVEE